MAASAALAVMTVAHVLVATVVVLVVVIAATSAAIVAASVATVAVIAVALLLRVKTVRLALKVKTVVASAALVATVLSVHSLIVRLATSRSVIVHERAHAGDRHGGEPGLLGFDGEVGRSARSGFGHHERPAEDRWAHPSDGTVHGPWLHPGSWLRWGTGLGNTAVSWFMAAVKVA